MVYLIIGFGGLFALFWVLALIFATRTVGERSLGIPGFWIVVFGAIAGFGLSKYSEATSNPEKLVKEKYTALQGGLNYADLVAQIGQQPIDMSGMDSEEVKAYDLTKNRIKMPSEITGRLAPGIFDAERQDAELGIEIFPGLENYEADTGASKRNAQNKSFKDDVGPSPLLGSSAIVDEKKRQGHGLIDLKVRFYLEDTEATEQLKETRKKERTDNKDNEDFEQSVMQPIALEGKEWFVTEGVDWTYEDNMTAAEVADGLAKAIDAMPEFMASYEVDEDALIPNSNLSVQAEYCLVDANDVDCPQDKVNPLAGDAGNQIRAQIMTGDNKAILMGRKTDGSAQQFFGGADEVQLVFWEEAEPFLDDDFNSTPRLIVAGLLRKKLVAVDEAGLNISADVVEIEIPYTSAERSAMYSEISASRYSVGNDVCEFDVSDDQIDDSTKPKIEKMVCKPKYASEVHFVQPEKESLLAYRQWWDEIFADKGIFIPKSSSIEWTYTNNDTVALSAALLDKECKVVEVIDLTEEFYTAITHVWQMPQGWFNEMSIAVGDTVHVSSVCDKVVSVAL